MTLLATLLAATLAVSAADRLAMADRQFRRGEYAAAMREYTALRGSELLASDVSFRILLTAHMLGDKAAVLKEGAAFLALEPTGEKADRARLMVALSDAPEKAAVALRALDRDDVAVGTRAEALYHLAAMTDDPSLFERVFKLDPKGRFAGYAKYRHAAKLVTSDDPAVGRKGVAEFMDLAFGASDQQLARDALYGAAPYSYRAGRYGESSSMLRRYAKTYPNDSRAAEVRRLTALCLLAEGKCAEAVACCTDEKDDTLLYVKAAASHRLGLEDEARRLALKYLEDFASGPLRKKMDLQLARLDFSAAVKRNENGAILAAAKRCAELSSLASDMSLLAWAQEKAGDADSAERTYAEIARTAPGSDTAADALYRRAMSLLRRERWAPAEVSLAEALATGRLTAERKASATYWRGIAASRLGHTAEAVAFLEQALAGSLTLDERREAKLIIADADFNAGRRDKARTAYAELVREGAVERMGAAKTLAVGRLLKGDEARTCAQALVANKASEWRQAGFALLGDVETAETNLTAAAYAYRKCLEEPCVTEVLAPVSVKLGLHLVREGDVQEAERVLKRAVELNAQDPEARASAYLGLARAALLRNDSESAKGYATVVQTLFENTKAAAEAKEILK